jgi:hypothetical protein
MNDNRLTRYKGRNTLRKFSSVKRCRECGWAVVTQEGVGVRFSNGVSAFAGLATCGRVWLCPVCNSKVMASRAIEIAAALLWAEQNGLKVIWGSLTVRHTSLDSLKDLITIQQDAWRKVVQKRFWKESKANRLGYIRASEITTGVNGWHPHFHPIIFFKGTRKEADLFSQAMVSAWVNSVEASGGSANIEGGQQLRVVSPETGFSNLSGYVTKSTYTQGLALEAVWSQGKTKRSRAHSTSPHWALLDNAADGLADDIDRWHELEKATRGHRLITWSRGLRELVELSQERTDEDLAASELGSYEDTVCFITLKGWKVVRGNPDLMNSVLRTLEVSGWKALRELLEGSGVDYFLPFASASSSPER